jgi:hypothetical protein
MKEFFEAVFITICLWVGVVGILWAVIPDKQTYWIIKSCELAEISPDFTPQEKADCRVMRGQKK